MRTPPRIPLRGIFLGTATVAVVALSFVSVLPATTVRTASAQIDVSPPGLLAAGDGALVSVEHPAPGTAAALLAEGVMVVRDLERYLLVVATPPERARLSELGLSWRLLDESVAGRTYYTVLLRHASRAAELRRAVRVLRVDEWDAVIEAPPAEAERLAGSGFEIAKVFLRPIRPARADAAGLVLPRAITADPAIQAIVDSVLPAEINTHVQRLQNFVTRYSPHDSCGAAAQYIANRSLAISQAPRPLPANGPSSRTRSVMSLTTSAN